MMQWVANRECPAEVTGQPRKSIPSGYIAGDLAEKASGNATFFIVPLQV